MKVKNLLLSTLAMTALSGAALFSMPINITADAAVSKVADTHADSDVVQFGDPQLKKDVAEAILGDPTVDLTYGDIKNYSGSPITIHSGSPSTGETYLTSLAGLEALQMLKPGIQTLDLDVQKGVSFAPLANLRVVQFDMGQDGMHNTPDLETLNTIQFMKTNATNDVELTGIDDGNNNLTNTTGLTSADLPKLLPFFQNVVNAYNGSDLLTVNVGSQDIKDFTFFNRTNFDKSIFVFASRQYEVYTENPVEVNPDGFSSDTKIDVPSQVVGIDGKPILNSTKIFENSAWAPLVKDGTTIKATGADVMKGSTNSWIIALETNRWPEKVTYGDGSELETAGMQYYAVDWKKPTDPVQPSKPEVPGSPALPSKPTPPSNPGGDDNNTGGGSIAPKNAAVYSLNNIYLYKNADFKNSERMVHYVKKARFDRPMFVVTGYARSKSGALRYQVRDVNHFSKTDGKRGYITANWNYVRPVYYQTKHSTITVINPTGVNSYKNKNLTGKVHNYKQGTVLKVKGMVTHNLTTRYILTNGQYVTANRKLVNMGLHKQPTEVKAKTSVNRYKTVNLTGKNRSFKRNQVFKVIRYECSNNQNVSKYGTLRYRVSGGYITGNSKYVQVIN